MTDLFEALDPPQVPLAERMRPKTLDEVAGQAHLLGPGKPLRLAFESRRPHSMILWGPPGVGKTTLARLMARGFDADFTALSAVFSGVKEIREAIQQAQADISDSARIAHVFAEAAAVAGRPLDGLVNNAGVNVFHTPLETSDAEWRRAFAINLDGAWACARAVLTA